jgi:hypothetical protein
VGLETLLPTMAKATSTKCLIKINVEELCRLVGLSDQNGAPPPLQVIQEAIPLLLQKYQLETVAASSRCLALALTNGRQPAYLALNEPPRDDMDAGPQSQPQRRHPQWTLYQLPVATQLETMPLGNDEQELLSSHKRVLYPIGAGDAVAAGTLAAWHYLHSRNSQCLPRRVRTALDQRVQATTTTLADDSNDQALLVAVAFGLACGSASCLHEENSKVHIPHVLQLFETTPLPTRLTTVDTAAAAAAGSAR